MVLQISDILNCLFICHHFIVIVYFYTGLFFLYYFFLNRALIYIVGFDVLDCVCQVFVSFFTLDSKIKHLHAIFFSFSFDMSSWWSFPPVVSYVSTFILFFYLLCFIRRMFSDIDRLLFGFAIFINEIFSYCAIDFVVRGKTHNY